MKALIITLVFLFTSVVHAEEVFRINVGGSGYGSGGNHKVEKTATNEELQRRVLQLERAVDQLQRRVYQMENVGGPVQAKATLNSGDSWVCTISAMGDKYTGTGGSKAVAIARATETCKAGQNGDGFFCKDPSCTQ